MNHLTLSPSYKHSIADLRKKRIRQVHIFQRGPIEREAITPTTLGYRLQWSLRFVRQLEYEKFCKRISTWKSRLCFIRVIEVFLKGPSLMFQHKPARAARLPSLPAENRSDEQDTYTIERCSALAIRRAFTNEGTSFIKRFESDNRG